MDAQTNTQPDPSVKTAVIERLNHLPITLMPTVLALVEDLVAYHQKTTQPFVLETLRDEPVSEGGISGAGVEDDSTSAVSSTPITTWDQFFDEVSKLPPLEGPPISSLTKQERRDLITEAIVEKYEAKGIVFPS